jgi:NADPH:quinone reductase-like Zn-dependent oxidoreductase
VEIGGAGTLPQSISAVRVGGHISLIGVLAGFEGNVPTAALFGKNATLKGITVGSRAQQRDMIAAIEASNIQPVIDRTFPLEELAAAFRHQESQQHFGKICIAL